MATEFKILRGNKNTLIDDNGVALIPSDKLVNGYWYLTNDTAEVFVCLEINGKLELKKINECSDGEWDEVRIEDIESRLTQLEEQGSDVLTLTNFESFPKTGQANVLYVDTSTQQSYIWLGTEYVSVNSGGAAYEEPDIIFGGTSEE